MAWRFIFLPQPDKHPEIMMEELRKIFRLHPTAKQELVNILVELGVID